MKPYYCLRLYLTGVSLQFFFKWYCLRVVITLRANLETSLQKLCQEFQIRKGFSTACLAAVGSWEVGVPMLLLCASCPPVQPPGLVLSPLRPTRGSKALFSMYSMPSTLWRECHYTRVQNLSISKRVNSGVSQICSKFCIIFYKLWIWGLLLNLSMLSGSKASYRHDLNVYGTRS